MFEHALKGKDAKVAGGACETCTLGACPVVTGFGPSKARLVIVGEAPGNQEVATGRPFVGRAGELLDKVLEQAEVSRDEIYVTNTVLCRPWPHRAPANAEIAACQPRLLEELKAHKPDVIIALGNPALRALLGKTSITKERGSANYVEELGATVIPTYHPAYVLRNANAYVDLLKDIKQAAKLLDSPIPAHMIQRPTDINYVVLTTLKDVRDLEKRLAQLQKVALDVETASDGSLLSLGLSWKMGTAVVLTRQLLFDESVIAALNRMLGRILLIGHNLKFDIQRLWAHGVTAAKTGHDTMLMHYANDERRGIHDLKYLANEYFKSGEYDYETKKYKTHMEDCPTGLLYRYNALDVSYTYGLEEVLWGESGADERRVLTEIMHPASDALARMEFVGARCDREYLGELEGRLQAQMDDALADMTSMVGEFNPRSYPQLTNLLYNKLGLPVVVNREGNPSTDEDALNALAQYHPLPQVLLRYRKAHKGYATYVEGILGRLDANDRIHTRFNQHVAVTGRLSSAEPNLQNIPRDEEGHESFRNIFVATPGYTLVNADLSQAEIRVWAWMADDHQFMDVLAQGGDIHKRTASMMFKLSEEDVTKHFRTAAKKISFGLPYGKGVPSLAADLGVSVTEAQELVDKFFSIAPKAKQWLEDTRNFALAHGYVKTPFGRTRRFPLITRENRNEILRQAVNAPIQSTASDITLKALVRLDRELLANRENTRLLLTVHDSIMLETRAVALDVARFVHKALVDSPLKGLVLEADVEVGQRWGELEKVEFKEAV